MNRMGSYHLALDSQQGADFVCLKGSDCAFVFHRSERHEQVFLFIEITKLMNYFCHNGNQLLTQKYRYRSSSQRGTSMDTVCRSLP